MLKAPMLIIAAIVAVPADAVAQPRPNEARTPSIVQLPPLRESPIAAQRPNDIQLHQPSILELQTQVADLARHVEALVSQLAALTVTLNNAREEENRHYQNVMRTAYRTCYWVYRNAPVAENGAHGYCQGLTEWVPVPY